MPQRIRDSRARDAAVWCRRQRTARRGLQPVAVAVRWVPPPPLLPNAEAHPDPEADLHPEADANADADAD